MVDKKSVVAKKRQKKQPSKNFIALGDSAEVSASPEKPEEETEPNVPSEEAEKKKKKKRRRKVIVSGSKEACKQRGVVYLSNIPDGFYESQMSMFFSQFGAVTNLKLGRSRKTGRSRGYAFVEFRYTEVAEVVAQTMDNYLMFERLMKCKLVAPERVRPKMFTGRIRPQNPPGRMARAAAKKEVNKKRDARQELRRRRKQYDSLKRSEAKLRAAGVDIRIDLPEIEREKRERRERMKAGGRTPVMEVDDSDLDITLKTPPNVRKVRSRVNSAAASPMLSGRAKHKKKEVNTPSLAGAKVAKKMKTLLAEKAAPKRKGAKRV